VPATASKLATAAKPTLNILYGESDEKMLATYAAEFKKAGHHVTSVLGRHGVQDALKSGKFDLVVLGASLSKDDRHHLPYMVKKAHQGTKVLVLHAGTRHHEVDAAVDSAMSTVYLLEKIAALFQPAAR
jgi:DNA-binding NtrC family response regulator